MCNLYTIKATKAEYLDYCSAIDGWCKEVEKTYVSPGRPGYRARQLDVMNWGFPYQGKPVTNVRNYASPFWRSTLSDPERRCLVPVTEFIPIGNFAACFTVASISERSKSPVRVAVASLNSTPRRSGGGSRGAV